MNTELVSLGGTFTQQGLASMSRGLQRQTSRVVERVQSRAVIAGVHEEARAFLTDRALQNVGALSALEAHLIEIAPLGEARYKHIVDAYALGAATTIQRW